MIEVLKQMYQLLLTEPHAPAVCDKLEVILRHYIAELESQEPVAWIEKDMHCDDLDPDSVTCEKPTISADGWEWVPLYTTPPQRTEQNFCSRCGKRTADLTTIHTCTPPQD
jgi:hypothetical protein